MATINLKQPMREVLQAIGNWTNSHANDVVVEKNRALAAEKVLQDNIDTEVKRATGAESTLQGNIDTVSANLTKETERATQVEAGLQSAINTEYSRATSAESALSEGLTSLINGKFPVSTDNIGDAQVTTAKLASDIQELLSFCQTLPTFEFGYSEAVSIPASSTTSVEIKFNNAFSETPQVFTEVMCNTLNNILVAHVTYVDTTKATIKLYNGGVGAVDNVTVDYLALAGR